MSTPYRDRGLQGNRYDGGPRFGRPSHGRPGPGRSPYDAKPVPPAPSPEDRLRELILRVGDKAASTGGLERNVQGLARAVITKLDRCRTVAIEFACECVLVHPFKTAVYATFLGLLNAEDPSIGLEVVGKVVEGLREALKKNHFLLLKYYVKFAAELANAHVISLSDLFALLELFVSVDDERVQGCHEGYAMVVLAALPHAGEALQKDCAPRLQSILDRLALLASERSKEIDECVSVLERAEHEAYFPWVVTSLLSHAKNGWPELSAVLSPWKELTASLKASTLHPVNVGSLSLPPCPDSLANQPRFPPPKNRLRLFASVKHPMWANRELSDFERFVIEENMRDIMKFFHGSHAKAAEFLLAVPFKGGPKALMDVLCETVFSELFALPRAPFKRVYYGLVFTELCNAQTDSFPPVLAKAVLMLYEKLEELDMKVYITFTEWFAHHLSNFEYKWIWNQWANPPTAYHERFIREVLARCVRLALHERLEKALPSEVHHYLPPKPKSHFKYLMDPNVEGVDLAQSIFASLKQTEPHRNVALNEEAKANTRENIVSALEAAEVSEMIKVDALMTCLVQLLDKTYSHFISAFEVIEDVLKQHVRDASAVKQAIRSALHVWQSAPHRAIIAFDKFLANEVFAPYFVVEWILSEDALTYYSEQWLWELYTNALDKSVTHADRARLAFSHIERPDPGADSTVEDLQNYSDGESRVKEVIEARNKTFLTAIEGFANVITVLEKSCEDAFPLRMTLGMFKATTRKYHTEVRSLLDDLEKAFAGSSDQARAVVSQVAQLARNY